MVMTFRFITRSTRMAAASDVSVRGSSRITARGKPFPCRVGCNEGATGGDTRLKSGERLLERATAGLPEHREPNGERPAETYSRD
jgi:hypothetical protein